MPIHPQCKAFLDTLASLGGPPLEQLPVADARAGSLGMIAFGHPIESVAAVDNRTIAAGAQPIPLRVYRPSTAAPLPGIMFFHGGGFVLGDMDSHDRECRALANRSGCVVVAVDYRRPPEAPFPAAPEDCYAATRYVAEHPDEFGIDASRLGVAGDSAGGNLAAVVTLMARDRGGPTLVFQLLVYPGVDLVDTERPSMREYGHDHFISIEALEWLNSHYVPRGDDRRHPYASPLYASDLSGLPPAFVITAECDPIRDQAEAYAHRLEAAGVPVRLKRYDGMIHPFFSLGGVVDEGRQAVADAAEAVKKALWAGASAPAS
jgi:acetyl esterase